MSGTPHRRAIVLALFTALALLVPSGATVVPTNGPADHVGSQIELVPASGEGGTYATVENGDLVVDVSGSNPAVTAAGLNPDSVTRFDDVFLIRYTGSQHAAVWLSHPGEGLTVSVAGHPIESPADATRLGPNESVAVDLTFDTAATQSIEDLDTVTIHTREYNATETAQHESDSNVDDPDDDATANADGDAKDDVTSETDQPTTAAGAAKGAERTGEGGPSGGEATDATVSAVDGGTGDRSATTQTDDGRSASETQTTPFEALAGAAGQWPLGITAALVLGLGGLLVGLRPLRGS